MNRFGFMIPALLIIALIPLHRSTVADLTQNRSGVDYIAAHEQRLQAPPGAVVMAPWGWRYFALSYAQRVEGRMPQWAIVDHRADFSALTQSTGTAYTSKDSFYIFPANDFWSSRLGGAHLSSAGDDFVKITREPEYLPSNTPVIKLGDGTALVTIEVLPPDPYGHVDIVVWWTATAVPSRDYSTFVHVSDAEPIASNDDLIAQDDQVAPVYGLYPTRLWSPGELVREDHSVLLPTHGPPKLILVGMYHRDEAGMFVNLGSVKYVLQNGLWTIMP